MQCLYCKKEMKPNKDFPDYLTCHCLKHPMDMQVNYDLSVGDWEARIGHNEFLKIVEEKNASKLILPCNIGDNIYCLENLNNVKDYPHWFKLVRRQVKEMGIDKKGSYITAGGIRNSLKTFNKTWFIDYALAEKTYKNIQDKYRIK